MAGLSISQVAHRAGLRPSAIRYYEQIGILRPAQRISGQRRYDTTILYQLTVIQRARELGFALDEIRQLFFGFCEGMPASQRWQKLCTRKLIELETLADHIRSIQQTLRKLQKCSCSALNQCGQAMLQKSCARPTIGAVSTYRRKIFPSNLRRLSR